MKIIRREKVKTMILKMTNQNKKFYGYMGKFFGSRAIEKQINDRIYDDDSKEWYIYIEEETVEAFVSINKNVIKNIYTTKGKYLEKILKKIAAEREVTYSTVTNKYLEVYEKSGYKVSQTAGYKNFVIIYANEKKVYSIE